LDRTLAVPFYLLPLLDVYLLTPEKFYRAGQHGFGRMQRVALGGAPIKIWVISTVETPPPKVKGYLRCPERD